jgi:hypothetical protein
MEEDDKIKLELLVKCIHLYNKHHQAKRKKKIKPKTSALHQFKNQYLFFHVVLQ